MSTCPFCRPSSLRVLWRGQNILVIFSNPRLTPGHLLVIPRRHVEKPVQLTSTEQKELWLTVIKFQEKILARLAAGCDIRQNYRPFVKDGRLKVSHLHVHLLPRTFKDNLYEKCFKYETYLFKNLTGTEQKKIAELLRE